MAPTSIDALAGAQLSAYDACRPLAPPSATDPDFDLATAYRVLARIREAREHRGERMVGRKIGFTNRNIWPEYGVDSPIWAPVYDTTLVEADTKPVVDFRLERTRSPRIEPEIAFGLRAPIAAGTHDPDRILASVAWVAPAFEIVDCLYPDWKFEVQDTVAHQGLHAALILGGKVKLDAMPLADWVTALRDCRAALFRNGAVADRGTSANALGYPAAAVAFLADVLAGQPQFEPLAAGEVVTTGTLTAALPIAPGETWRYELEGVALGPLTVRFV
ncbi:MAG TPA: fumarylacetoacetate hydrolase family protein [Sandaracinaceae bacterium]